LINLKNDASLLPSLFANAVKDYEKGADAMMKEGILKEETQALLQSLQLQGSLGDCNTERPGGFFNGTAKAQWDNWNALKGTPKD
jgi:acyl-CoA-binding protein